MGMTYSRFSQERMALHREREMWYWEMTKLVLKDAETFYRPGAFSRRQKVVGIPVQTLGQITSGPQCVTVPIRVHDRDVKAVTELSERFAVRAESSFARVYRELGMLKIEYTLPPEEWKKVTFRYLTHPPGVATFGQLSTGEAARLGFKGSPHKLISGGTRSGKTICQTTIAMSLVKNHSPEKLRFLMINPKNETVLANFSRIPHLIAPIAVDFDDCVNLLRMAIGEMMIRRKDKARCKTRWVIMIDEVSELCLNREEAGVMITQLVQFAGALNINVVAATQAPLPSVFGKKGSLAGANWGGYVVFKLPQQYAYYATGGIPGVRTTELGCGSLDGKGDGYTVNGQQVLRFRGAIPDERDYENLPRTETPPQPPDPDLLAGDSALERVNGCDLADLADKAGYALALAGLGIDPSANRLRQQFRIGMDRARWFRDLTQAIQERTTYWSGQDDVLLLSKGGN